MNTDLTRGTTNLKVTNSLKIADDFLQLAIPLGYEDNASDA
jgi:hypothetical protein